MLLFKVPLFKVPLVKVPLHVHRSSYEYNGFNTLYFSPGPLLSSTSSNKPIPVRRFGLISDIHLDLSIEQCLHFNSTLYRYCIASGLQMIAITTLVHLTKLTTLIQYTCLNCLPEARSAEGEQFRQVYYDYIRT